MEHNRPDQYLFVYGTLRKGSARRLHPLLSGACVFLSAGQIRGQLFEVAGYPGVIETASEMAAVHGEVYRITDPLPLLQRLDRYEECAADNPAPHEYLRKLLPVRLPDRQLLTAWVYLYNRDVSRLDRIDSGDYLAFCAAIGRRVTTVCGEPGRPLGPT